MLAGGFDTHAAWTALLIVVYTLVTFLIGWQLGSHQTYRETCRYPLSRMLYFGLPMYMHMDEETGAVVVCGFWSWVFYATAQVFFTGHVLVFTTSYPRALWEWVTGQHAGDDDDDPLQGGGGA